MAPSPSRIAGAVLTRALRRWERMVERLTLPTFATPAIGFEMRRPRSLTNPGLMHIGRDVKLGPNSELKCQTTFPGGWMRHPEGEHVQQSFTPTLTIGDRVTASGALLVLAFDSVIIEDDVMFANNVFVADGTHAFGNVDVPFKFQGVGQPRPIRIGRGSWIGQNVVILPGVQIGAMAIVGSNSVVTRDVPERTIVVGSPARVLRHWNAQERTWADGDGPSA